MRKESVAALVLLPLSLVIAVGAFTFLSPCVHADGSPSVCAGAGRACGIAGIVLAVLSLAALLFSAPGRRIGLFFAALITSAAGILLPGKLFPLCGMNSMRCRMLTRPAMIILFSVALLTAAAGILAERGKMGRSRK